MFTPYTHSARGVGSRPLLRVACLLLSGCLAATGWALDPAKALSQYNVVSWRLASSGATPEVVAITQSPDGHVWTATARHAFRFEGRVFVRVQTQSEATGLTIHGLAPRAAGGVWIAAEEGLYRAARPNQPPIAVRSGSTRSVLEIGGTLWVGHGSTLSRFSPTDLQPQSETELDTAVETLAVASDDVWIGTSGGVYVVRRQGKGWPAEPTQVSGHPAQAVAGGDGQVWIGGRSGLQQIAPANAAGPDATQGFPVRALLRDRDGGLWVGTQGGGLLRIGRNGVQRLSKQLGLSSDTVTALFEDHEGTLWVGTSDGLDQITDVKFPIVGETEGLVSGSAHDASPAREGGVWVATSGGFGWTDGQNFRNYNVETLVGNIYVKLAYEARDGKVYLVRGDKSISVLEAGKVTRLLEAKDWPEAIVEDETGLVTSVGNALYRLRGSELVPYDYAPGTVAPFDWIHNVVAAPDGSLLICAANGFYHLTAGKLRGWRTNDGLAGDRTYTAAAEADGTIWTGGPAGLHLIRGSQVASFATEQGLPDERVYGIAVDTVGYVWVATGRGIARIAREELIRCADGKQLTVPTEVFNGPPAVHTTDRSDQQYTIGKSHDGRLWVPGPRGVIVIDPARIPRTTQPPVVYVERTNAPDDWDGNHPGRTVIEFNFAALTYGDPAHATVSYRLLGLDNTWINAGERRAVEYQSLPPGNYALEVRAVNSDGFAATKSRPFRVVPPFYQTVWFYLGSGAVTLALFGTAWRFNMRRVAREQKGLLEQNEKLEEAVAERTRQLSREQALRVEASRRAGMAEVAANVLHNVGNVLNSANVSASLVSTELQRCRIPLVPKLAELLESQQADLPRFLQEDPRGQKVPTYLSALGTDLMESRQKMETELRTLQNSIEHIKEVVAMQQGLTHICGVVERIHLHEVVEDALRIQEPEFHQHRVAVRRTFEDTEPVAIERHKALQIAINLLQNAVHACRDAERSDRVVTVRVDQVDRVVRLILTDNGVGIAPENMTRIFSHGFTTKPDGHGFGLHGSALAAQEMGGSLTAHSDGPDTGATFTLTLPLPS